MLGELFRCRGCGNIYQSHGGELCHECSELFFICSACHSVVSVIYRSDSGVCQECSVEKHAGEVTDGLPLDEQIFALRSQGWSLRDVSEKFGISEGRATKLTKRAGDRHRRERVGR
jgi:hypothetical protein